MCTMYNTNTSCGCSGSVATSVGNRVLWLLFGNGCYNTCQNNTTQQNVTTNGCSWDCGYQRICRDACGCIHVNQQGCCNGGVVTNTPTNTQPVGNGCRCHTPCCVGAQPLSSLTGDAYYARLYGTNAGCGCCGYNFNTTTTTQG